MCSDDISDISRRAAPAFVNVNLPSPSPATSYVTYMRVHSPTSPAESLPSPWPLPQRPIVTFLAASRTVYGYYCFVLFYREHAIAAAHRPVVALIRLCLRLCHIPTCSSLLWFWSSHCRSGPPHLCSCCESTPCTTTLMEYQPAQSSFPPSDTPPDTSSSTVPHDAGTWPLADVPTTKMARNLMFRALSLVTSSRSTTTNAMWRRAK